MNRYEFTTPRGYKVGPTIEARTAIEARDIAIACYGRQEMLCTHLSDCYSPTGIDRQFFDGPQDWKSPPDAIAWARAKNLESFAVVDSDDTVVYEEFPQPKWV